MTSGSVAEQTTRCILRSNGYPLPGTLPPVASQRRDSVAPPGVGPSLAPPLARRV